MINIFLFTAVLICADLLYTLVLRPLNMKCFPKYAIPMYLNCASFDLRQINNRLEKIQVKNPILYAQLAEECNIDGMLKIKSND